MAKIYSKQLLMSSLADGTMLEANGDVLQIANNGVLAGKYAAGSIATADIAADAITSALIADGSIDTAAQIANDLIDSQHYAAGSIDLEHMAADSVDGSKIADDSIDSEHYVAGSIDLEHMAADSVDGSKIADESIDSDHYVDGSIDTAHFAAGAVDLAAMAANSVDSDQYVDGSIDTVHLSANAVTAAKADLSDTWVFSGVVQVGPPGSDSAAANKQYVDQVAQGLSAKESVRAATVAVLPAVTYANGTDGVGATLTADANGALAAQDGITLVANERLLVKTQATPSENGIYFVSDVGSAGTPFILTRALDNDELDEQNGAFVFVEEGTVNADSGWVQASDGVITIGTSGISWTQFSGAGSILAGAGMTKTGNTLNVIAGDGLSAGADLLDLDLSGSSLAKDGGLRVASDGIVTAMIADDQVTLAKMAGLARGRVIYGDAAGDPAALAIGTSGYVLASDGTDLGWSQVSTAGIADDQVTLDKMAGLARGKIIYGDASGDPAALALGSANQILQSDGTDIAWATRSALSVVSDTSGLAMSSFDGSGAVSDLALDFVFVSGFLQGALTGGGTGANRTGTAILSGEQVVTSANHPALSPVLFRNGVLYAESVGGVASSYTHLTAPSADGEWGFVNDDINTEVDLLVWETNANDFDNDEWSVIMVPVV